MTLQLLGDRDYFLRAKFAIDFGAIVKKKNILNPEFLILSHFNKSFRLKLRNSLDVLL